MTNVRFSELEFAFDDHFLVANPERWATHSDLGVAHEHPIYDFAGGHKHPTLFKLLRNARRAARTFDHHDYGSSLIMLFEPRLLPFVLPDQELTAEPGLADRISEAEFAERQVQLWADRAARARENDKKFLLGTLPVHEDHL